MSQIMDDLKTILDRIKKPLTFAARDNFAHIKSLAAMEQFIHAQVQELRRVSEPIDGLSEIEKVFSGFDSLTPDEKKKRVLRATELIEAFESGPVHPVVSKTSTPPEALAQHDPLAAHAQTSTLRLDTPVQYCKGIGPKRAELLKKLGVSTIDDALSYLPWRYEDRGNLKKISRLAYGSYETVSGEVVSAEVVATKRQRVKVFELLITDKSGMIIGSWFNQPFMKKAFKPGQKVILSGIVRSNPYKGGVPQIDNPEYEIMDEGEADSLIHTGRTVPIYRATAGLSVRYLRAMMKTIIDSCGAAQPEPLPDVLIKKYSLMPASEAIAEVHFPTKEKDITILNRGMSAAHRRMSFEELLSLELGLALKKRGVSVEKKGISFKAVNKLESELRKGLPFQLTKAQERVIVEIKKDMMADRPMNRLVQGDVGSGKTVIAMMASLMVVENGYQACIMAPTEILAEQHYKNISTLARPLGVSVCQLVGGLRKKAKEGVLADIESGEAQIVIGTHALIEQSVKFKRLGLAIIDEQHRFGVMQRSTLTSKGYEPDVLIMTATPIPRTLALTVYGDLDVSVVDEMPPGRKPVVTRLYFENRRQEAYQFIESELKKGRQVYVVYPLVEETEKSDLKAATEMAAHLQKDVFTRWKIGLLHGRMKGEEKEAVMAAFKGGEIQVLVSTTVIEVGVDVANAAVMVIEHPERFGLAQLHQLRGRVGRGDHQSYCILMGPRMFAEEARERLNAFARTNDGFKIAEEDLRIRGPGEFFGTRQSGLPDLRAANIIRDADLLETARTEAFELIQKDPELSQYPRLRDLLQRKWQGRLGLISVG
ncbi:MAG TPA: ATP-dependent DNA helicase RecG [Nitrospirota bacterium]|nr:ATP-dependent DNA helicase RecG [Nitrospirota bacterium]